MTYASNPVAKAHLRVHGRGKGRPSQPVALSSLVASLGLLVGRLGELDSAFLRPILEIHLH